MEQLTVRKAVLTDLDVLLGFEQGIIQAERPFDSTLDKDPISYYDLKLLIKAEDAEVLVCEVNGHIVGSGYAKVMEAKPYLDHNAYCYLGFMYTVPSYRGKGVNAVIIDGLKKWALTRGLNEIRLTVYTDNEPAIRSYEKAGFEKHLIEMRLREDIT